MAHDVLSDSEPKYFMKTYAYARATLKTNFIMF